MSAPVCRKCGIAWRPAFFAPCMRGADDPHDFIDENSLDAIEEELP